MSNLDKKVFGIEKFSNFLWELYYCHEKKDWRVLFFIKELKNIINDIGDATLIVPLVSEFMDLGIKNDEQLIKMATIIQRALNTGKENEDDFGLSEDEKKQLFTEIEKFNDKTPKKLQW